MGEVQTNLRVLKRSRKPRLVGDVFAMQLPDESYLFGRVIGADLYAPRAPMPTSNLIYTYRHGSAHKEPDFAQLTPDQLLLPPTCTNQMPWTKGYFETLGHREITQADLLRQYCFWNAARACFVDENDRRLPRETQPCGDWALVSYRYIDDRIS